MRALKRTLLFIVSLYIIAGITGLLVLLNGIFPLKVSANVNVYFTSNTPVGTQSTLLANTTTECSYTYLEPNTFPDSYDIIIGSCAPVNSVGTVPEPDYVYGWANGATYNQYQQVQYLATLISPCLQASSTTFTVAGSTDVYDTNISTQTCADVVTTIQNELWQILDSTPTTIPGGF